MGQIITSFTCVGQGLFDCYFRFEHLTDGLGFDDILLNFDDWLPVLYDVGVWSNISLSVTPEGRYYITYFGLEDWFINKGSVYAIFRDNLSISSPPPMPRINRQLNTWFLLRFSIGLFENSMSVFHV